MNRIKCCEKCNKRSFKCHKTCTDYAVEKTVAAINEVDRKKEIQLKSDEFSLAEKRAKKREKTGGNWNDKRFGQK